MVKGDLFTTTGNKSLGDRSYTGHIWRIVEEDECHVWAVAEFGDFWVKGQTGDGKPRAFLKRDFDLMPCHEDVLTNLMQAAKGPLPIDRSEQEQVA